MIFSWDYTITCAILAQPPQGKEKVDPPETMPGMVPGGSAFSFEPLLHINGLCT